MSERNLPADRHDAGRVRQHGGGDHVVLRHTLHVVLGVALVTYFLALLLVLGLRYVVLPQVESFRPRIEAIISEKIHAQVSIGKLTPHWVSFQPGVEVTDLTIRSHDGHPALSIPHASATVSWSSLWKLKPILSSLVVDQPDLLVERNDDGTLSVAGVQLPSGHSGNDTFSTWLLRQQAMVLRGGTLRWRDALHDVPEVALQNIRLAILNDGNEHRFALQAPADGKVLFGPLDVRVHFKNARTGAMGKPINWSGSAYLSTGPVDLPMLARYIDFPIATYAGRIDNAIWVEFAQGRILSATGELSGNNIALRVRPTQPKLDLPDARFSWTFAHEADEYTLQLHNLVAELGQPPMPDGTPVTRTLALSTLNGRLRRQSVQHGQLVSVAGDRVDLGILAEFTRALPLPRRLLNSLVRFNPRGIVSNYTIEVEREKPESGEAAANERSELSAAPIAHYTFKADLQGISVAAQEPPPGLTARGHPRAGIPGFENLWGSVDANEKQGSITLDTANAAITMPGVFDNPRLTFDRLKGKGSWTVATTIAPGDKHKAFKVDVSELTVANEDTAASASASYSNVGHGRGSLDLSAKFERAQVSRIARYLPTGIAEKVRVYLGHSLEAGVSRGGTIEIHGNLDKFPYALDPTAGVFRIVAPFTDGRFDPTPYPPRTFKNGTPNIWPGFDGIDGEFQLKENLLRFDVNHAHYKRIAIGKVTGKIDDLGNRASSLVITGGAHGPLADMLDYVDDSSLGIMSKHFTRKLRADGPAAVALKLTLPRAPLDPNAPRPHPSLAGSVTFESNRIAMEKVPTLSQLTGKVHFTEHTAEVDNLAGQFFGGDIHANGALRQNGTYALDLNGHIALEAARELDLHGLAPQVLSHMQGGAPYQLSVRGAKGRLPDVSARSDLTGLALDFPAPFNKPAGTPMPLSLSYQPPANGDSSAMQRADVTLGPIAATYLLRGEPQKMPKVVRGAIGVNRPADLPSEGVTAAVDLDTLDADAWRALFVQMRNANQGVAPVPPSETVAQFVPNRFALHIGTLTLLKRHWESVVVGASHIDRKWQANIASSQVSGYVSWLPGATRDSPGTLQARLARLVIPSATENDLLGPAMQQPAQNMPTIDLVVNDMIVHGRSVGRLEVDAHNFEEDGEPVWQLDKLDISNPAATFTATANWRTLREFGAVTDENTPRRTVVDFKLDVKDAGALLERAGLPRTLKNGEGTLSGKVGWRGGPTRIDLPSLNGNLSVDLHHGQILKVDPGVARLLGVLSLQSLQRVATLSFRDVFGEGLPFSSITGTGEINDGVGRTDNFRLVTAPARAEMRGTVDLAHETQDLNVRVIPTVSAGAGVVAATIVNPLFGLGALAADIALSQSLEHAFVFDYAITGSWAKPHVERVHDDRGKMNGVPAAEAAVLH